MTKSVRARQVAAVRLVEASALSNERVCRRLGLAVGAQLKMTRTLMELEAGASTGPLLIST